MRDLEKLVQPFAPVSLAPSTKRARPAITGESVLIWGTGGTFGEGDKVAASIEINTATSFKNNETPPIPQIINVVCSVSDAGILDQELLWPDNISFRINGLSDSEKTLSVLISERADVLKGKQFDEGIEGMSFVMNYDGEKNKPATKTTVV